MQIKKIDSKLNFGVEAQKKCPHGKWTISNSCTTDCKTLSWTGSNAAARLLSSIGSLCTSVSVQTCYYSHRL